MADVEVLPVGDYEGETHWQGTAGAVCAHESASAKVSATKIVLSWEGSEAGEVTLQPSGDSGHWKGKYETGEPCEFEAFRRGDDAIVLWGRWGDVNKPLDRDWFVRLYK
ncbi:MAG TPA: hypothetical protein VFG23_02165 [Polyangia bacterium]|nr:hypothetical protein [Polyangia bacterium]